MTNIATLEIPTNNLSEIGLEKKNSKELAKKLTILLANYSIFYQNVRGYHWNLKGEKFFELHIKFEQLYEHLYLKIDEIAERVVTLGHLANHNFSSYGIESKIKEQTQVNDGIKAAHDVYNSLKTILNLEREIFSFANKMQDEGTSNLMSDFIKNHEKLVWMYAAFLGK